LVIVLAATGCATVLANGTQTISIEANPGAAIVVDGHQVGTSPAVIEVSSHDDHDIVVGEKGCHLSAGVGVGWLILDIVLIEMIFPIVVDAATGNWKSISVEECRI
jgi:hypothetical protein